MRWATLLIIGSSVVTAASVGSGIGSTDADAHWTANDDISDYDGTPCSVDQFYDATAGACTPDVVTNDPQDVVDQQQPGLSDPGTPCKEDQFFSVDVQQCMTDAITNDPQATITPEGEDPTDFAVPTANGIPDCDSNAADPMWICA